MALFISQSGETADTLAALRDAKAQGQTTLAIVNVPESSIAREADVVLPTFAGPEIGVASTKAFTCQLSALAPFAIAAARARGHIDDAGEKKLCAALLEAPRHIVEFLKQEPKLEQLGQDVAKARDVLYLGRGPSYPLALEGALKLKEISYIHAEGYAAGEMKHGPIALIDENVPVIVIAPHDALLREDRLQHAGGDGARRQGAADLRQGRGRQRRRPGLGERSKCRRPIPSSRRCSMPFRCSCSPITPRSPKAPTSISRAISPRA